MKTLTEFVQWVRRVANAKNIYIPQADFERLYDRMDSSAKFKDETMGRTFLLIENCRVFSNEEPFKPGREEYHQRERLFE